MEELEEMGKSRREPTRNKWEIKKIFLRLRSRGEPA